MPEIESVPDPQPGERVQSTATGDLLARLATSPKLDEHRFVVGEEVGRGGMGAVRKVFDRFLHRRLAMKVLLDRSAQNPDDQRLLHQLVGRFLEEAQVTSQLDHPGVVPVHEIGLDGDGKVYFTMRLVKGRTASEVFADAVAGANDWTLTRALEVVLRVCDAMAYAHEKGVLHRDLKPTNVMVGRFGEVYVMDWGLAKVMHQEDHHDLRIKRPDDGAASQLRSVRKQDADHDSSSSVVSMDGQQLGTPSYMSPEQARSEALDKRTDVYAIGAMLYELLTGQAPYEVPGLRQPAYRILEQVVQAPPQPIDELRRGPPAELVAIVARAMARDREQRYPSVAELASDLRAFLSLRVVKAYSTGALAEARSWMRRNRALAASLTAVALLLVGGIVATAAWASEALERAKASAAATQVEIAGRKQLAGKIAEYELLASAMTLDRLLERPTELVPGWPDQMPAIEAWLEQSANLLSKEPKIRETIDSLNETQFLRASLNEIVNRLPQLSQYLPSMKARRKWASDVRANTSSHPNARVSWSEARASIARDSTDNPYRMVRDTLLRNDDDVWGLVPIGENPRTKLWEFYDLRSAWDGSREIADLEIPTRDANSEPRITGSSGIVFVLIPPGEAPDGTISERPFFLAKHEVTRGQWRRWTGRNPVEGRTQDLSLPAVMVSFREANAVLRSQGLHLPTAVQWARAIRGGTRSRWWTGDEERAFRIAEVIGREQGDVQPVGSTRANPFGLFDMGGNVREWCTNPESDEICADDEAPCRGGDWNEPATAGASSNKGREKMDTRGSTIGLRPARAARRG